MNNKELTFKRLTTTDCEEYLFAERLLVESFPIDEYRDIKEQRANVKCLGNFHMNIICFGTTPIGIISFWKFDTFTYIEHFAIHPEYRNCGYGASAIKMIAEKENAIILEVEEPSNEISRRRIAFYQRCGLTLCRKKYIQPAYRNDGNEIPMFLMSCGVQIDENFENIKNIIYRSVYGK